jgi:hypothetical protein
MTAAMSKKNMDTRTMTQKTKTIPIIKTPKMETARKKLITSKERVLDTKNLITSSLKRDLMETMRFKIPWWSQTNSKTRQRCRCRSKIHNKRVESRICWIFSNLKINLKIRLSKMWKISNTVNFNKWISNLLWVIQIWPGNLLKHRYKS